MFNCHFLIVMLSLLLLSISAQINWQDGTDGNVKWANVCDYSGFDIGQESGIGDLCGGFCVADCRCTHFSWSYNICYLKRITDSNVVPTYRPNPADGVCGFVVIQSECTTTTLVTTTTLATTTTTAGTSTTTERPAPATNMAALAAAAATVAVAIAVGVAVSVGSAVAATTVQSANQANQIQGQIVQFIAGGGGGGFFNTPTPVNDATIPVFGDDQMDDGCGDSSIRFQDGICYPVLKRGPCSNPFNWITVNPVSMTGQCSPRLCGKGRVFVGADGLCHDSEDPLACRGGRKLFYTAYGDPICDCPVGQYPFPGVKDDCVTLFTQDPCPSGQVVAISRTGSIRCTPSKCQFNTQPLALFKDGFCYALGSKGPCRRKPLQLFGYDVFRQQTLCVNATAFDPPYFVSEQEENFMDTTFNQLLPEYDDYRVFFVTNTKNPAGSRDRNWTSIRRQGGITAGLFQLPNRLPNPLLNPCRPGSRNGNNCKCTNPLVLRGRQLDILQVVRPAFECPNNSVLQATGLCGNDTKSASCGPSYQFIEAIGQCRALFRP